MSNSIKLPEEEKIPLRIEINKIISILERPENHKLEFDLRLLKKWIQEYNPELSENHIHYIAYRALTIIKAYRLKMEDPEKYAEFLRKKREYNKTHSKAIRKYTRKRYLVIKANPILYGKMRASQKRYFEKKHKEDPEFRKRQNEYQKKRLREMKEKNPKKYLELRKGHLRISKFAGGIKCPKCGFGIKTVTAGKNLGKRPIQCPKCRCFFPKNQSERIRIPRILPITKTEIKKQKMEFNSMTISEQALEGLKNLEKLASINIYEDDCEKIRNMWNLGKIFDIQKKTKI
jgi:hypothetical protein